MVGDRRWRLRRSKKDQGFLVFEPDKEHSHFSGRMFEAEAPPSDHAGFPGVPISPSILSKELKLKMAKLTIRFQNEGLYSPSKGRSRFAFRQE